MTVWTPQLDPIKRWNPTEAPESTMKVVDSNLQPGLALAASGYVTDLAPNVLGGREPKTFSVNASTFPVGVLNLEPGGRLTVGGGGVPPGGQDQQFVAQILCIDANDQAVTFSFSSIGFDPNAVFTIVGPIPDAHFGVPFDFTPAVFGAFPPLFFRFQGLALEQNGFSFDSNTGRIFGKYTGLTNGPNLYILKGWQLGGIKPGIDLGVPDAQLAGTWNWFNP